VVILRGVIAESFEKVGIEPGKGTAAGPLATIDIAGVRANVQGSETGEISTEIEKAPAAVAIREPGAKEEDEESLEPDADQTTAAEDAPESIEPSETSEGQAPSAPSEEAPASEAPAAPPEAPASPPEAPTPGR
jgi:hypothetical protein